MDVRQPDQVCIPSDCRMSIRLDEGKDHSNGFLKLFECFRAAWFCNWVLDAPGNNLKTLPMQTAGGGHLFIRAPHGLLGKFRP